MTTQVRNGAQYTLEEATAGLADARLSAVQPVYCLLCIFDKWLHFYILIGNRNNTSEALERPQVPAQTGDESVSNERERLSQEKKNHTKPKKHTNKQTNKTRMGSFQQAGNLVLQMGDWACLPLWGPGKHEGPGNWME